MFRAMKAPMKGLRPRERANRTIKSSYTREIKNKPFSE
jgi:hypothetical protein